MRTAIILAGALIGRPDNLTTWIIFAFGIVLCLVADLAQTSWINDKFHTKEEEKEDEPN